MLGTRLAVFALAAAAGPDRRRRGARPPATSSRRARYSARDLAVSTGAWQGAKRADPRLGHAVAGSWQRAARRGPLPRLHMPSRIGGALLPRVRLVDMNQQPAERWRRRLLAPPLLAAIRERGARAASKPGVPEPARLCAGAALRRLRLEERLPALQRLARVPQARPHAALPPLRLHRAACPRLPGLRQPRHRTARAAPNAWKSRSARCWRRRRRRGRASARIDADSTRLKGSLEAQLAPCTPARSTCWWARRWSPRARLPPHHPGGRGEPRQRRCSAATSRPERLFALLMRAAGRAAPRPSMRRARR